MKILDRYLMTEMAWPFLFGLCTFTLLFFSAETLMGVARMVVESEAGFSVVVEYLYCRLPYVLVLTFPMSILLSALMAYGRLSGDSELVALKAGGIGFFRIFVPGLAFCTLVAGVSLWMNDAWVPPSMKRAYDILIEHQRGDELERALITTPRVLANGQEQMIYAHSLNVKEKTMRGVFIHFFWESMRLREIYAHEARWNGTVWEMKDIKSVEFTREGDVRYELAGKRGWTALSPGESPPDPDVLRRRKLRPEEMTRAELAESLASMPVPRDGDDDMLRKRNRYLVMYHQKISLPLTCMVFGTFAIPLGIRPHRTSTSIGLGLSLLFILLYYVLMTVGMILGETGTLQPWAAAWLPNILFGLVGFVLVVEASRK